MPRLVFSQSGSIGLQSISQLVQVISPWRKPILINNSFLGYSEENSATIIGIGPRLVIDITELTYSYPSLFQSGCIIRNYIEPGSIFITDKSKVSLGSYAVIGDTHHVIGSIYYAYRQLEVSLPLAIISLANPLHLGLWSSLSIPLLTYPWHSYVDSTLGKKFFAGPQPRGTRLSVCGTLTHAHSRRSTYIRRLLHSPYLANIDLFERQSHIDDYLSRLSCSQFCIIPSLNFQVSPQTYFCLAAHCFPMVECKEQLVHSQSDRELSQFCLDLNELDNITCQSDDQIHRLYRDYLEDWLGYLTNSSYPVHGGEYGFFCESFLKQNPYCKYNYTGPLSSSRSESMAVAKYFDQWLCRDDNWKGYAFSPHIGSYGDKFFAFYTSKRQDSINAMQDG